MRIIMSPAKGFREWEGRTGSPVLLEKAEEIAQVLKKEAPEDLEKKMKISRSLSELNSERYRNFSFEKDLSPAIFSFEGTAFKALEPETLDNKSLEYLENHLFILSGLYGALKPEDGIRPYRLDLNDGFRINGKSLKTFFGDSVYRAVTDGDTIVNLASKEYSSFIIPYIKDETLLTCSFKVRKNGKRKEVSTLSKKARGKMVRFMAENRIEDTEELKNFNSEGFRFYESVTEGKRQEYIFIKEEN